MNLEYIDNSGRRIWSTVEPYSLRQAQNGNVLLYAARADDGRIRAYKVNQIKKASITNRVFEPRYEIELNAQRSFVPTTRSRGTNS